MMVERIKDDEGGTRNSFIHSLRVANGDSLERRLKKELEEQGILEPGEEEGDGGGNDEILAELARYFFHTYYSCSYYCYSKTCFYYCYSCSSYYYYHMWCRCQQELRAVSQHNQAQLRRLAKVGPEVAQLDWGSVWYVWRTD